MAQSREKIEHQKEHFNEISERYRYGKQTDTFLSLRKKIWQLIFSHIDPHFFDKKVSVIEPMCGYVEGHKVLGECAIDHEYTGFDYSDDIVADLEASFPKLNFFQADVTTFEPTETYDLILLIGGLHHVPDMAQQVVNNMTPCLSPGGYFINFEPTHASWMTKKIRDITYKRNDIFDESTERGFAVNEWRNFFKCRELTEVNIFYPGLLAYVLFYNPYAFPSLNKGGASTVRLLFELERPFYKSFLARYFSFASLGIWQKN